MAIDDIILCNSGKGCEHVVMCRKAVPRGERLAGQRDDGRAGPQYVHAGGVSVAERRVEAHVGELAAPHVLLLRRHV